MKKLTNSTRILLFGLMCSLYFFSYFHRIAVPGTIFNEIQETFVLSASGVASLGTICLYIYGFMQFFAGLLADALGALKVLLVGAGLLTAGSFAFAGAPETGTLFASRALVGFGASLIYVCLFKALHELFSSRDFPAMLGVALFLGYSGGLFGTLPLERMVSAIGWRAAFFWISAVASLFLVGATLTVRWKVGFQPEKSSSFSAERMWQVYTNRQSFPVIISAVINFSIYFLIQAMLGRKFLQDFSGFSSLAASSFTCGMIALSMTASLLAGFGTRALNRRKPIMVAATVISLAAVSLLLLGVAGRPLEKLFLLPYLLLGLSSGTSVVFSTSVRELNPAEAVGTAVGFLNGICYLSIAVLMNLSGWVLDLYVPRKAVTSGIIIYPAAAYRTIFLGCWVLALVSLISSLRIKETAEKTKPDQSAPLPVAEKIRPPEEEKASSGSAVKKVRPMKREEKKEAQEEQLTLF